MARNARWAGRGRAAGTDRRWRRLVRCARGATTVEMAIVSIPFFLLLMAIIEQGLLFYRQEVLQVAVTDAARLIRTGQTNAAGTTQEQFRQQVCAGLPAFMPCASVSVDVRPYASFAAARPVAMSGPTTFDPGNSGGIVVVSGMSVQAVLFPMMNPFFSSGGPGKIMLTAQATFRNEPW